jgi:hypothetical protein
LPLELHSLPGRSRLPQTKLLDFEAFIHAEVRASGLVLPAPSVGPLLRFTPLRVVRSSTMTPAYPKPSAHGVDELAFENR